MKTYADLNKNEIAVLKAIAISSENDGGDFTYFDYVMQSLEIKLSNEQVKGYFSQLEKKKYIIISAGQICASLKVDYLTDYKF